METKINQVTASAGPMPFTTTIRAGNHTFVCDEPASAGGSDKGPKPHDILLASLGACTCITIRMYASRKGWDLKEVTADLRMERSIENGIQTTHITESVSLTGNLDPEMRARLIEIGNRCPVQKTLGPAVQVTIQEMK